MNSNGRLRGLLIAALAGLALTASCLAADTTIDARTGFSGPVTDTTKIPMAAAGGDGFAGTALQIQTYVNAATATLTNKTLDAELYSIAATVTAGTNAQGQAALTKDISVFTTTSANPSGATLATPVAGLRQTVINRGTNPVNVFPPSGKSIDALSTNASMQVPVGGVVTFTADSTSRWNSTLPQWVDYTPTITSSVGTITSVTSNVGKYKLEGDRVTVEFQYVVTTNGTGNGLHLVSLPFAAASSGNVTLWVGPGRENALTGKFCPAVIASGASQAQVVCYDNTYPGAGADGANMVGTVSYRKG